MSEQTQKDKGSALVVHFPAFLQAEGMHKEPDSIGYSIFKKGTFTRIDRPGSTVRIGDCVIAFKGKAKNGDIHVDLYADSQSRVPSYEEGERRIRAKDEMESVASLIKEKFPNLRRRGEGWTEGRWSLTYTNENCANEEAAKSCLTVWQDPNECIHAALGMPSYDQRLGENMPEFDPERLTQGDGTIPAELLSGEIERIVKLMEE